jgi:primosomal protein N' (replication factor Y)
LVSFAKVEQQDPPKTALLHGATGSGKTEIYLRAASRALELGRQALVLVPEINLTPQLEARFFDRFPGRVMVSLHSGLTPAQRLRNWLLAHLGVADLVLGTRLAVFASLPRLGLIVVDEEHDPSFKQQEGARYSARDLSVWRGHQLRIPVLLGSATPSLESWQRVQEGRYVQLAMPSRIGHGAMPRVRLVDMGLVPKPASGGPERVLAPTLLTAIEERLARGEQSLLLLNRRGYAPVLHCSACGWKSGCPHCSAWRVFHKLDRTLRCHHCGLTERVPRACPDCGNLDIAPIGRGTEKLQEQLAALLPQARVARLDADSTRAVGSLQQQLQAVHAGDVDILVGTQMLAKGHDFRRVTLVAAVNPDAGLFSSDFRAPERLFALLMQAAGRAGRDAANCRRQRDVDPDLESTPRPVRGLAGARLSKLRRGAAGRTPRRRSAALCQPGAGAGRIAQCRGRDGVPAGSSAAGAGQRCHDLPACAAASVAAGRRRTHADAAGVALANGAAADVGRVAAAAARLARPAQGLLRWAVDIDPLAI